jgi:hypothetical protein
MIPSTSWRSSAVENTPWCDDADPSVRPAKKPPASKRAAIATPAAPQTIDFMTRFSPSLSEACRGYFFFFGTL